MNPMQGPQDTGASTTEVNQANGESVYCTDTSLSNIMNPVDTEFPNISMPSGRLSSSSHACQNHNWDSSSMPGPSDQVHSIGVKTNHQLSLYGAHQFVGYGSEGREPGSNDMIVHGGNHAGSHIMSRPSFLLGSSSHSIPQHAHRSMDMYNNDCGAKTSGVVVHRNNCGRTLGSSIQFPGEISSGSASLLGGRGSSRKRKAPEGAPSHCFSHETPNCVFQTENGALHAGLSQYGALSSSSLAIPSQTSPNVTNPFGQTEQMFGAGSGRAVAASVSQSTRNTDHLSRPGRRLNPMQPHESVAFSISRAGTCVRSPGSLQQSLPLNSPFVHPLDVRSTSNSSGSSNGENQTNIVHLPALTRNIHQFASDYSLRLIASNSSGTGIPAEGLSPQWETPRSNPEQPIFAPATDMRNPVHDQSNLSLTSRNTVSSIDSPFVPLAGASSSTHGQLSSTWVPPQSIPLLNPSRTPELSPWSLFSSIESQSASRGASLPLLPTGPSVSSNEVAIPSNSNSQSHRSQQRRSELLSERNEFLYLCQLQRRLAAEGYGRDQIISEVRQAVNSMRTRELRVEGMTEGHDRHQDMRLDIDNMSYEELLALGEQIGDVSTGLSKDFILKAMKQQKYTSSSAELHQDIEPCCICQEEYVEGDDLGTLNCGHDFHRDCIKQWLMLKNRCPICKIEALTT